MDHHEHEMHGQAQAEHRHAEHAAMETGHGEQRMHHEMMIRDFKKRFWISLAITVPVLVISHMIQRFFGFVFDFPASAYVLFTLSSVVFIYGGMPFLTGLRNEIKAGEPGMMTLISVAIIVAYLYSAATVFGLHGEDFFWELVTLIDIMLLGHWLEMRSVLGASKALEMLASLMPAEAHLVHGTMIHDVKLSALQKNDVVLVKPGEKIPADGIVIEGESYVNESMLTGESKPVKKENGSGVIGGSMNGNGSLHARIEHTGAESYLHKVIKLVEEAQSVKSKTQRLADRAAKWLAYIALGVGAATMAAWLLLGYGFSFALERMVTVMVISCPHALGLAIPLVAAISTTMSARNGLLIRNRTAFENARLITTIVFDKTGTLTKGIFGVTRYETLSEYSRDEILRLASGVEQYSEHPIAMGIVQAMKEQSKIIPHAENFRSIPGEGVEGTVDGKNVKVVSPAHVKDIRNAVVAGSAGGAETVVFVVINGALAGSIALADEIRPESRSAIALFRKSGVRVMMATGDNAAVAKAVSDALGLDGFFAEVLPHQKVEIVKDLQTKGQFVAMTGDGVNDAPALAQADVGIAVGSGTDIAAETADIILVNSNPQDILRLILFGKATYRKMLQNLMWATGYNVFAIPLAAGVLYSLGILLSPAIGAVLMSLSTIIVAANAQLLKRNL